MSQDELKKTFTVTLILSVVCSLLVSSAAVGLRDYQKRNRKRFIDANILMTAGLYQQGISIEDTIAENIQPRWIDLKTGDYYEPGNITSLEEQKEPTTTNVTEVTPIEIKTDRIGVQRDDRYARVYVVEKSGKTDQVILPIEGKGLFSTLHGFIALDVEEKTVRGINFYDHGETPGLGGEVDNVEWKSKWIGKKAYAEDGSVAIEVIKGVVIENNPTSHHQVDGLSGATFTSKGINDMLHYWLGPKGFGPFLSKADFSLTEE